MTFNEIEKLLGVYESLSNLDAETKLTEVDKLYIKIKIEQIFGMQLVTHLCSHAIKLYDDTGISLFDKESVRKMDTILKLNNFLNRAELIDVAFEALNEMRNGCSATMWREDIINGIEGNWGTTESNVDAVQRWKDIYVEGMDFLANWAIPLYNTCFCALLYMAMKRKRKNTEEAIMEIFKSLREYIVLNDVKFEPKVSKKDLKAVKKRPDMIRVFSDYIVGMLDIPEGIKTPITLNDLNKMIPRKVDGDYLNYMKLQFMERDEPIVGWNAKDKI